MEVVSSSFGAQLLYDLPSLIHRLDLDSMFAHSQPLEVELGSGDGSFLAKYAQSHPDRNFIGVERLLGRLRKLDRKGRRLGLQNLRCLRIECAYFLEYLLPPGSIEALHVYFPDPWPKRKHAANRLVNERFPVLAGQALKPGGVVYLRTDDADYYAQMKAVFGGAVQFESVDTPLALSDLVTDFEADFLGRGIPTRRAAYRRRENPAGV